MIVVVLVFSFIEVLDFEKIESFASSYQENGSILITSTLYKLVILDFVFGK